MLEQFQQQLNIQFNNPDLLLEALTHRSYANERASENIIHNERLEFLGDAVLDFTSGNWLFHRFPESREGKLTRLRSALVNTEMLAKFALQIELDQVIRLGHGEKTSKGNKRPSNLAGAFEAVIGAMYLDQGLEIVRQFILPLFESALTEILQRSTKDYKSRLQEWSQAQTERITPSYHVLSASGPDHDRQFLVEVRLNADPIGWGTGSNKKSAQQAAAAFALKQIQVTD